MPRWIEVASGTRFGKLAVISETRGTIDSRGYNQRHFQCLCDCGKTTRVSLCHLRSGHTTSCGCLNKKHGNASGKKTREYQAWCAMHARCKNPKHPAFASYGGRGICVSDEWNDFSVFLRDMGKRPEGRSLDRINNDGPYAKDNCRWATVAQQNNNRRKRKVTIQSPKAHE